MLLQSSNEDDVKINFLKTEKTMANLEKIVVLNKC